MTSALPLLSEQESSYKHLPPGQRTLGDIAFIVISALFIMYT